MKILRYFTAILMPLATTTALAAFSTANGITIGQVANNVASSGSGVSIAIEVFCYVVGLSLIIRGILAIKNTKSNPNYSGGNDPIANIGWGVVTGQILTGIFMLFAPEFISTGGSTIWGNGAQGVNIHSGNPW